MNKNNLLDNLLIRELIPEDYEKYIKLMEEFTNYKYSTSYDKFKNDLILVSNNCKILVIINKMDNDLIGAGSIFKIHKLHNNPIGQIEDVIVTQKYRGYGLGKVLIKKLVEIGLNDYKCYKIILNCNDENIKFYEACGFLRVGNEFKFVSK